MRLGPLTIAVHRGQYAWISRWPVDERELHKLILFCMERDLNSLRGEIPVYHIKCVWQPGVRMSYMALRCRGERYARWAFRADEPFVLVQEGNNVKVSRFPLSLQEYNQLLDFCTWSKAFHSSLRSESHYNVQFLGRSPRCYPRSQLDRWFG